MTSATSAVLAATVAAASTLAVLLVWRWAPSPHDWSYLWAAAPCGVWFACAAYLHALGQDFSTHALDSSLLVVARLAYQAMFCGAFALLVHSTAAGRQACHALRGVLGGGARTVALALAIGISLCLAALANDAAAVARWLSYNAVAAAMLTLWLVHRVRTAPSATRWMTLLSALFGVSVWLTDLQAARSAQAMYGQHHLVLLLALFCLWLGLRHHASGDAAQRGWMSQRQLAQELHDGVGSQLTSILSTLDHRLPQQRHTAVLLQQCLLDLKLLVDGMETDATLMGHLASLRYRMQPVFEQRGVQVRWVFTEVHALEQVQGPAAKQLLRVLQEALANVLQHAEARVVTVTGGYFTEAGCLYLCVADDGCGFEQVEYEGGTGGKGLSGMRARVEALGGQLVVESEVQLGTLIQLIVPLQTLRAQPRRDREYSNS